MERFINIYDVDLKGVSVFDENLELLVPLSAVRKALQMTPTADVVPKSEVEELIKSVDDMLDLVCAMTGLELTYYGKYAELKKKYIGEQ